MTISAGLRGPERIRPGLVRIGAALDMTGHPEAAFRTIHIAGTNGKGSTACFAEAILRRVLGEPVGLYTSPHLLAPEERIRVGGEQIPAGSFSRSAAKASALSRNVEGKIGEPLSYFEEMTWIAFDWFRRRGISLAVMEAGLGGRWDATNVCVPEASVVTNVGMDHKEWLGSSLGKIASEKAGILREGTPAIVGDLAPSARKVIVAAARERGCRIWETGRDLHWEESPGGLVSFRIPGMFLKRLRIRMQGEFQRHNALLAVAASWIAAAARGRTGDVFERAVRDALAEAKWPGRYSPLAGKGNAGAWVDGAHNPAAASALARELAKRRDAGIAKRIIALWSMLGEKDHSGFLRAIAPVLDGVVAYPMDCDRAAPLRVLTSALERAGIPYRQAENFSGGWEIARKWAGKDGMTIVCGSLMAAADAYRFRIGAVA